MTEESAADSAYPAKHKPSLDNDEVSVDKDGAVRQKGHGSMDETMIPQKPEPDRGRYVPPPGHLDNPKDVEPPGHVDPTA